MTAPFHKRAIDTGRVERAARETLPLAARQESHWQAGQVYDIPVDKVRPNPANARALYPESARQRMVRAQNMALMGSWELGDNGQSMSCSPELATLYAVPQDQLATMSAAAFLARVHVDERAAVAAARQALVAQGEPYWLSFRILRFDGEERTVYEQGVALRDAAGRRIRAEGITQDITARVRAEQRAAHVAHHDAVTGLPNRQFFGEIATRALERSARLGSTCALLHLDIDRFKTVNDAFGQAEGDRVLRLLAERLEASVRLGDVAGVAGTAQGPEGCVARVGANAFTVLLHEIGGDRQAALVAARLQDVLAAPVVVRERDLTLTASIGIAMYPRDATEAKALARCAEQAAYAAKAAGRAQQRFFDEGMNAQASVRLMRETELRRAIAQGELRLAYQPKVDAATGRILGAEALVRWQHPSQGMVPPAEFIPLAEECGLILPLTAWVLETACAHLRQRIDAGLPAVPVAVNLSSASFVASGLLEQLQGLMLRHALAPELLTLEVTESLLMQESRLATQRLGELRAAGFRLSLDDFGTGYSSLSYLRAFPVHEIKIDRSFIAQASHDGRDSAIARSIIALGREFGLDVVAEGVETADQAAYLVDHGCPQQQGYHFARPLPGADFDALLAIGSVTGQEPPAA